MAYNLPPAWDPGFALPENVDDEGLERRALVTKQMPRGTYDNPAVGGGGYDVPQYVLDEGYGQGTYTSMWQPGGTYNGPKVPNWLNRRPQVVKTQPLPGGGQAVTVQALGDDPLPAPYEDYGQSAAAGLISQVATLPQNQRAQVLRSILDRIDKSIWPRTQDIFRRYLKQGMSPSDAFPLALARAMGSGMVAEVINTGLRRTAPQAKSLLGLGCYGCAAALGATGGMGLGDDASCTHMPGFTWKYGATINGQWIPGHWERPKAGEPEVPFCPDGAPPNAPVVQGEPEVRDHRTTYDFFIGPFGFMLADLTDHPWVPGADPNEGKTINRAATPDIMYIKPDPNADIPVQPKGSPIRRITPDVVKWLSERLREAKDANGKTDTPVHYTDNSAAFGFPESDAATWFSAMGIDPTTPLRLHVLWNLRTAGNPFAGTTNPTTKKNMVMHIQLARASWGKDWDPTANPLVLKVWLNQVPEGDFWDKVSGALLNPMILINPLTAAQATAQVTKASLDLLTDLGCKLLKDPQGKAAAEAGASAVAAYYGMPPQAGAEGVDIAASACGGPPPPPPPLMAPASHLWPMLLLAGGAITAVYFLTKPKKKKAP